MCAVAAVPAAAVVQALSTVAPGGWVSGVTVDALWWAVGWYWRLRRLAACLAGLADLLVMAVCFGPWRPASFLTMTSAAGHACWLLPRQFFVLVVDTICNGTLFVWIWLLGCSPHFLHQFLIPPGAILSSSHGMCSYSSFSCSERDLVAAAMWQGHRPSFHSPEN